LPAWLKGWQGHDAVHAGRLWPSCATQRKRPSADPGEEMALIESDKVIGGYILN
jgi:hypothetical protein